jgi:hypothetical protein
VATSYVDGCVVWLIIYGLATVASLMERNALITGVALKSVISPWIVLTNGTKITNTQNCNRQIFMASAQNGKKNYLTQNITNECCSRAIVVDIHLLMGLNC